jgi:hypothetical protein
MLSKLSQMLSNLSQMLSQATNKQAEAEAEVEAEGEAKAIGSLNLGIPANSVQEDISQRDAITSTLNSDHLRGRKPLTYASNLNKQ